MYIFNRQVRLAGGNTREAMTLALGLTEKANQITALGVSLYAQVYSPDVGMLVWSAVVPDLATLEAATDKLQADDGFVSMTDEAAEFIIGTPEDAVLQIVHGEIDPNRSIEYVSVVQAVCANGKVGKGIEVGVEIAQRVERIIGSPTLFVASTTGTYGGVGWISGHANIHEVDTAQTALASDPSFGEFVDREAGAAYAAEPALTTQLLYRRLA